MTELLKTFSGSYRRTHDAVLYRAEGYLSEEGEIEIFYREHEIQSYTPCGVWIDSCGVKNKFVNLRADKQWACVTKAEALYSLKRRKQRQVLILRHRLKEAEATLNCLKEMEK